MTAAVAVAAGMVPAGCLPDPEIHVPDFAVPQALLTDMAVPVSTDGPSGDLGSAKWDPDTKVGATEALRAAWVVDPGLSEIYVVGLAGTILHRSGGDWKRELSGTTVDLYGVAGRSPDEVYAVGRDGVILRRSAGKWSIEG